MYILCSTGAPQRYEAQKEARLQRLIYHPEARKGIGVWDFKAGETSHGTMRREKCMVNKSCTARQINFSGEKMISDKSFLPATSPLSNVNFIYKCRFPLQKGNFVFRASPMSVVSQDDSQAKEAYFGVALHLKILMTTIDDSVKKKKKWPN